MADIVDDSITLEYLENGRIQAFTELSSDYFGLLIGAKGATKKRIEKEAGVIIKFPPKDEESDIVIVSGRDANSVRQAVASLNSIIKQAQSNRPITHFLGIPCTAPNVQGNFIAFRNNVLQRCSKYRGIDETIFITPERLHSTVAVFMLNDEKVKQHAVDALHSLKPKIINTFPDVCQLRLHIKGIEIMSSDPQRVHVVYAKVEAGLFPLQKLFDFISDDMNKHGGAKDENKAVKVHVTLMNSRYRETDTELHRTTERMNLEEQEVVPKKMKKRESFDASGILREFGNYDFGEIDVKEIHLSMVDTTADDGYYSYSKKIDLSDP